ncbi:MAG TPA: Fe-Mn family superoxide dismutase [Phycisphaerales bacterium]|nr:Fe-Mn family superoxide dismutase [Phycisphaerales bacterium]
MPLTLPQLPYPTSALEPHIDAQTMEIHYGKHHKAYVDNANKALEGTDWADKPVEQIIQNLNQLPEAKRAAVRNNAGGHFNHSLFWRVLAPPGKGGGGQPTGELAAALGRDFGSIDGFKQQFAEAAKTRFGSGWAWLCVGGGKLAICSTPNQDSPLMGPQLAPGCNGVPILGLDVWEHAYYLKYQNRRPDYIDAWWNVVNWEQVSQNYRAAGAR